MRTTHTHTYIDLIDINTTNNNTNLYYYILLHTDMSLFKARELWYTYVGSGEVFDQGCICIGNINNHSSGATKIIVGSFNGTLRIYDPNPNQTDAATQAEDLMLEVQLDQSILQVATGRFVSGSETIHLAVLHPRKVAVYTVAGTAGVVEHGCQYQLNLMYSHTLQRASFNMTHGAFGNVKGRDFLCVQSMDGVLSFFEQESFSFSRFLPGCLLPGPLRYVSRIDSFITVSSTWTVECYRYQVLAVAQDSDTKEDSQKTSSGKRVAIDWSYEIGENAIDVQVTSFPKSPQHIFILGERSLFCLKENGVLRFMKKFEYNPSCFLPYATVKENTVNTLVCTHNQTVMVYQDMVLQWAAQLTTVPVAIRVARIRDYDSMIITLDEEGKLYASYLGTDPTFFSPCAPESRDVNYEQMDREMSIVNSHIKQHSGLDILPKSLTDNQLSVLVSTAPSVDKPSNATDSSVKDDQIVIPSVTAVISLKSSSPLTNVVVSVSCKPPLVCSKSTINFPTTGDIGAPAVSSVYFYLKEPYLVSDLSVQVSATFTSHSGVSKVCHTIFQLPLCVCAYAAVPVKLAQHKITIDTNKSSVALNLLFPDFVYDANSAANAIGIQILAGPRVTILASKTSQRYRIQSDSFEGMWLVINDFIQRISKHFNKPKDNLQLSYTGTVPLQDLLSLISTHWQLRKNAEKLRELMSDRANQFRTIQRRLLTRFKDKTPSPLQNLDTLLEGTYEQLLALADAALENEQDLLITSASLSCAVNIVNHLIKLWLNFNQEQFTILQSCLTPVINHNDEQGWEESVDAALTHLLRTCLSKNAKDQSVSVAQLKLADDITRLHKHITMMCDRLGKGCKLVMDGVIIPTDTVTNTEMKEVNDNTEINSSNHPNLGVIEEDGSNSPRQETTENVNRFIKKQQTTSTNPTPDSNSQFDQNINSFDNNHCTSEELPSLKTTADSNLFVEGEGEVPDLDDMNTVDYLNLKDN